MASTFNTLLPNILVLREKKRASTGFLCLNPMFIKKIPDRNMIQLLNLAIFIQTNSSYFYTCIPSPVNEI